MQSKITVGNSLAHGSELVIKVSAAITKAAAAESQVSTAVPYACVSPSGLVVASQLTLPLRRLITCVPSALSPICVGLHCPTIVASASGAELASSTVADMMKFCLAHTKLVDASLIGRQQSSSHLPSHQRRPPQTFRSSEVR
eukprot:SAG31_NODE_2135_length_6364_cov_4.367438_2_plen_142_part_00